MFEWPPQGWLIQGVVSSLVAVVIIKSVDLVWRSTQRRQNTVKAQWEHDLTAYAKGDVTDHAEMLIITLAPLIGWAIVSGTTFTVAMVLVGSFEITFLDFTKRPDYAFAFMVPAALSFFAMIKTIHQYAKFLMLRLARLELIMKKLEQQKQSKAGVSAV